MPIHPAMAEAMEEETPVAPEEPMQAETAEAPEEGPTALLPKEVIGSAVQVGDQVTLKIVRIMDDQVEVAYGDADESGEVRDAMYE
jgi:hypothetical protein